MACTRLATYILRTPTTFVRKHVRDVRVTSLLIMMYYKKEFQSSPYLEESLVAESFPFLKSKARPMLFKISRFAFLEKHKSRDCPRVVPEFWKGGLWGGRF
jgi:hypothetical protein